MAKLGILCQQWEWSAGVSGGGGRVKGREGSKGMQAVCLWATPEGGTPEGKGMEMC